MDPQRTVVAGPMTQSSLKLSRKNIANTNFKPAALNKEIEATYTATPVIDHQRGPKKENQIYDGEVNVLAVIDADKEIRCCKYIEDCSEIAVGYVDGSIRLFDCRTGNCTRSLVSDECFSQFVTSIHHRPVRGDHPITNTLVCTYVNGSIKCWLYKYEQCLYTVREKRELLGLSYHPRLSKFITYGDDARLNMYDEEAQTRERSFYASGARGIINGHWMKICECTFHPKSNHELMSGGWDDNVMCWDDRVPFITRRFEGVHMCGKGLAFNYPGDKIITCAWQDPNSIQVWDYGSCKLIETIVPDMFNSKLYCCKVVPKMNLMVCGGSDINILRLVDLNKKKTTCSIRKTPGGVCWFDFGGVRQRLKGETINQKRAVLRSIPRVAYVSGKKLQIVDFGRDAK